MKKKTTLQLCDFSPIFDFNLTCEVLRVEKLLDIQTNV